MHKGIIILPSCVPASIWHYKSVLENNSFITASILNQINVDALYVSLLIRQGWVAGIIQDGYMTSLGQIIIKILICTVF